MEDERNDQFQTQREQLIVICKLMERGRTGTGFVVERDTKQWKYNKAAALKAFQP
jgi:hypothetical protein